MSFIDGKTGKLSFAIFMEIKFNLNRLCVTFRFNLDSMCSFFSILIYSKWITTRDPLFPVYFCISRYEYMTRIRDILGQQGITQERLICTGPIVPCPCRNTNKIRLTIRRNVPPCKHQVYFT